MTDEPEKLETRDIQGLVTRGFGNLPEARFLLLEVVDPVRARAYLRSIIERVNTASAPAEHYVFQVAFTAAGLERLGISKPIRDTFAREFLEGMDDDVRAESLGDRGDNDPGLWEWGHGTSVHVLLMLYAEDKPTLGQHLTEELSRLEAGAFRVVHKETRTLPDQKEHFGWADGLSMPLIEGVPKERPRKKRPEWWTTAIKPGEFVLGYRNEYDCFSESPTVELAGDPGGMLAATPDGKQKDLGRNGTYLVYREMTQDVLGFWDHLARESREPGDDPAARALVLGSKMVGRWPGGAPVSTIARDDLRHAKDNTFTYAKDLVGLGCPLGAHIRRANPRANLAADRSEGDSIEMVRKHQMIRRGRAYGPPVVESMDPREILAARGQLDYNRRGLHFICLVGHISRQFEFVQRAWIHSANFLGLYKDGDPISAARRRDGNANDEFTCPAEPLRRKYKTLPRFTQLVGGSYFFLPGIRALRFIAKDP